MTLFPRLSFHYRIFTLNGVFAIVSIAVIWFFVQPMYERQVTEDRTTVIQELQHFAVQSIDERLGQWITITHYLAWNLQTHPNDAGTLIRQQIAFDTSIIQIIISSPDLSDEFTATSTGYPQFAFTPAVNAWTVSPKDSSISILWMFDSSAHRQIFGVQKFFLIDEKRIFLILYADSKHLLHQLERLPIGGEFAVQVGSSRGIIYNTAEVIFPVIPDAWDNLNVIQDLPIAKTQWKILFSKFSSVPMSLIIGIPRDVILQPVNELLTYSTAVILGLAVLIAVFGWIFSRQLSLPVTQLVREVERLKSLDFSMPIDIPKLREIAAVATTIESMRTVLERYQRINVEKIIVEEWKNKFFLSHSEDGICITDSTDAFSFMNDRFIQIKDLLQISAPVGNKNELLSHTGLKKTKETFREETNGSYTILFHQIELLIESPEQQSQFYRLHDVTIARGNENLGSLLVLHDLTSERMMEKMKTEMMNFIVHELRNPLNSIMGFASFIKEEPEMNVKERLEYITIIQESSRTMNRLVNRFLDVQRLESQSVDYHKEPTDLVAIAKLVCDSQRPQLQEKSLVLTFGADDGLPKTMVSPDLMREAFLNLVSNAIKYGDEHRTIEVVIQRTEKSIKFIITDHGYGISSEDQEKLFSKFFRVTTNKKSALQIGTGLGLAHVKEVMKFHKGDVTLESNNEIGCRFTLTIPIV
ncbi:MAG: ATP-binding protein [Bacteroidetes bacterium]|nr:ATP-binding protein [Bacteroidota bacterium]